ncbi:MAG TPA: sulfotransferase [Dehalococcoidia bacterium]|nr:sulfotransferase [Dehalococcoidia bacterium]
MTPDAPIAERLIFLFSLPRSGSTLLQTLLARNPDIFSESESRILMPPLLGYLDDDFELHHYYAAASYSELRLLLDRTERHRATYFDAVRAYAGALYDARLRASGKRLFLDKTPGYTLVIDEVVAAFPDAKIVFLLRNPIWVLASVIDAWHNGDPMKVLSAPMRMSIVLAQPARLAESMRRLEGRSVIVRYEDFVTDPEADLRRICDYLGVEFDDSMLTYSPAELTDDFAGDRKIRQHDRPVQTSLSLPPRLRSAVGARFALRCLERIGPQTYAALGYDYEATRRELVAQKRPFPLSLFGDAVYALAWLKLLFWSIPRHQFGPRLKRDLQSFMRAWRGEAPPHYADTSSGEGGDDLAAK